MAGRCAAEEDNRCRGSGAEAVTPVEEVRRGRLVVVNLRESFCCALESAVPPTTRGITNACMAFAHDARRIQ